VVQTALSVPVDVAVWLW